jgi:ribonuclease-3
MGLLDKLLGRGKPQGKEIGQDQDQSTDRTRSKPIQKGPVRIDPEAVEKILGYRFKDRALLILSLTHRSFTRFDPRHSPSNERLEFLGDSVLGLVISHQLFLDNPTTHEGELTKTKAMLVNEATLAAVASRIGLHKHLRLSPEEDRAGGRGRASIVSDGLESVLAAVFIDGGLEAARGVIQRIIYEHREDIVSDASQRNYKGELLEKVQSWGEAMPRYEVLSEIGPDHEKIFAVAVHVLGRIAGRGTGASKKEAEQKAAAEALENAASKNPDKS